MRKKKRKKIPRRVPRRERKTQNPLNSRRESSTLMLK